MPDHAQLLAEIERREALAQAAENRSPSPWEYQAISLYMNGESSGVLRDVNHGPQIGSTRFNVGPYVEAHDPADALRRYAHYRRILERHHAAIALGGDQEQCWWCAPRTVEWPCTEIRDLAEALGVSVDG